MKIKLLLAIATMSVFSCTSMNEDELKTWIENNEKPITCKFFGENAFGDYQYTLTSNDGKLYNTGKIKMILPDTIK